LEWGTLSVAENGEKEFSKPRHMPIKRQRLTAAFIMRKLKTREEE
jgi:hypothetical protein